MNKNRSAAERLRVVVVRAGFGRLSLPKGLARTDFAVMSIGRHNYHLFLPLLYQLATAGLSSADIASPVRSILRNQKNVTVILSEVSGVDLTARVVIAEGQRIPFGRFVISTGAPHAYFGHDDWASFAPIFWLPPTSPLASPSNQINSSVGGSRV